MYNLFQGFGVVSYALVDLLQIFVHILEGVLDVVLKMGKSFVGVIVRGI